MTDAVRDQNHVTVALGVSSTSATTTLPFTIDPITGRLLTDNAGGGSGTVTDVSVVSANGFAGTVATSTTTPAITISTTINSPVLAGNGTAISAATTTGSGSTVVLQNTPTLTTPVIGAATGTSLVLSSTLTSGAVAGVTGAVLLKGLTSGTVTLSVADAAGTWTMKLPTSAGTNGYFLKTDGSGNTSWDTGPAASLTVGTTAIASGTTTRVLYDNAGTLGEYTISGSGNVAMTTSPSFTTPTLGVASATSINKLTITTPATGSTLTIADGKTLTVSNTLTFTGTDASSVAFGAGGTVLYSTSTIPLTVGTTTIASGTSTRILYDNAGVLGEYLVTGSGTTAVLSTSPTFTTSIITPLIVGGTGTTGTQLTLKTTSGIGTTDQMVFVGGNNGATTFATLKANSLDLGTSAAFTTGTIELGAASDTTIARSSAGVITVEGVVVDTVSAANTLTNKTLTSPTIQTTPVFAAGTNAIYTVPTSDDTATGVITNAFNSGYTSSAIGDLVILDSSGNWQKTDANTASLYNGLIGIALEVKASGNALKVLLQGFAYCSTAFPTFTVGGAVYMSETAGAVTQTAPTTTDSATRLLGYAVHADKMWFSPSNDWITHV